MPKRNLELAATAGPAAKPSYHHLELEELTYWNFCTERW